MSAELVLIAKDDSSIGFYATAIDNIGFLENAVAKSMFASAVLGSEERAEVAAAAEQLKREGHISFEDGWLELRTGVADTVSFFMLKLGELVEDRDYHDRHRADALQQAKAAQAKHDRLACALRDALSVEDRAALLAVSATHDKDAT